MLYNVASLTAVILQFVSGILLVSAVLGISKYINKRKLGTIRKTTLFMHTGAFGFYLLSLAVEFAS